MINNSSSSTSGAIRLIPSPTNTTRLCWFRNRSTNETASTTNGSSLTCKRSPSYVYRAA